MADLRRCRLPAHELVEVAAPDRRSGRASEHKRIGFLARILRQVTAQRWNDRLRQRHNAATGSRLRRTEDEPAPMYLDKRLTNVDHVAIEIDAVTLERDRLAPPADSRTS
jgi:hypothetical protein